MPAALITRLLPRLPCAVLRTRPHSRLTQIAQLACLAFAASPAFAEPVTLEYSSTSTARQTYFVADPEIAAEVQFLGTSGSWALQRGTSRRLLLADVYVSTGPAVPACCAAEVREFGFGLTVAGITRQMTAAVRMTEIANDQYQFDMLDQPAVLFDLGGLGVLTVDLWAYSFQLPANTPFYNSSYVQANVRLDDRLQAVPAPATLALAALGLGLMGAVRRPRRPAVA